MKQADMSGKNWRRLTFRSYIDSGEQKISLTDPIIASVCGDEIDYGKLFAYCFRRFGYPNQGWDDYKELVSYYLTTPHSDMVLNITPCVGNTAFLTLSFYVEREAAHAIEDYARRDQQAWEQRLLDWAEQQGLPDWMPEWMDFFNTVYREARPNITQADNWRQVINFPYPLGQKGNPLYEQTSRVSQYFNYLHEEYRKVEEWPDYYERPTNLADWNDDDPLKPFVPAAIEALKDLRSLVGVRDQSINAFGEVESGRPVVKAASSAGYPSGALGNVAAKEFAELHGLVLKLGKGNAKRGIKKIISNFPRETYPQVGE
jgi:hypothetical protein